MHFIWLLMSMHHCLGKEEYSLPKAQVFIVHYLNELKTMQQLKAVYLKFMNLEEGHPHKSCNNCLQTMDLPVEREEKLSQIQFTIILELVQVIIKVIKLAQLLSLLKILLVQVILKIFLVAPNANGRYIRRKGIQTGK